MKRNDASKVMCISHLAEDKIPDKNRTDCILFFSYKLCLLMLLLSESMVPQWKPSCVISS